MRGNRHAHPSMPSNSSMRSHRPISCSPTRRGYPVVVVSWLTPDSPLAERDCEDYMREGIFAALDAVQKAPGQRQVNTVGSCIAGPLLAAALAYIAGSGENQDRIKSVTFVAA